MPTLTQLQFDKLKAYAESGLSGFETLSAEDAAGNAKYDFESILSIITAAYDTNSKPVLRVIPIKTS